MSIATGPLSPRGAKLFSSVAYNDKETAQKRVDKTYGPNRCKILSRRKILQLWPVMLIKQDNLHIVAFQGTKPNNVAQWIDNASGTLKLMWSFWANDRVTKWESRRKIQIDVFCGHSRGGTFASQVRPNQGFHYTFNAYRPFQGYSNQLHIRTRHDLVSSPDLRRFIPPQLYYEYKEDHPKTLIKAHPLDSNFKAFDTATNWQGLLVPDGLLARL